MINANELRIGNWVQLEEDGEILQIKISALAATEIFVDPIPLTPEILEKCGFEICGDFDNNSVDFWTTKDNFRIQFSNYTNAGSYFVYWWETPSTVKNQKDVKVSSLHQLQNLYFALTGNEIEYKP